MTVPAMALAETQSSACRHLQNSIHAPIFATPLVKPWGFWTEDGRPGGMLYDVAIELARFTGVAYSNQMQPYTRTVHSLKSGHVDFALFQGGKDTYQGLTWVGAVVETEIFMIGRRGMKPFSSLEDLAGQRVGHIRASRYGDAFDNAENFTRISIPEMKQGLAMLLAGRIDVMTSADITLYQTLREMNLDGSRISKLLTVNHIAVSLFSSNKSQHSGLVPCYRDALQTLREQGVLQRIFYVDAVPL